MLLGQAPLTTIIAAKEMGPVSFQPLLLLEITFLDGSILRLSSENLAATLGGPQYNGVDWLPRLSAQDLQAISSVSNNNIVQSPSVTFTIADGDRFILDEYEWTNGRGFKGAKLKIYFVYADLGAGVFSSDNRIVFVGTCNAPSFDATTVTVEADNLLNMVKKTLPQVRLQTTCNWVFPSTHDQRLSAATDGQSIYFNCGYSPDIDDPQARGNFQSGSTPFTFCDYTYNSCVARLGNAALPTSAPPGAVVQIERDTSGRQTARFSGLFWNPPYDWRGNDYLAGNKTEGINNNNDAKLNDYYPLIYGVGFIDPIVLNVEGDANSTRFEVALCVGELTTDPTNPAPIQAVLVNDQVIPFESQTNDVLNRWYWDTTGGRSGATMKGPIFNGMGNCYGGIATLLIVVPKSVQASSGIPTVRVLTYAPTIHTYASTDPAAFVPRVSVNPVWILLDMLRRADWDISQIDLPAFLAEANYCEVFIPYQALDGTNRTHQRYRCGVAYRTPRTVADVLTNYLASFRGTLRTNNLTGQLQVLIRKTLADQQPAPIPSSNSQTPIASVTATGASANGYVAYAFDESNIKWVNGAPSLTFSQRQNNDTPNRVTATFQDEDASFVTDTLSLLDQDDVTRLGNQTIKGNLTAEGFLNFDTAFRLLESMLAEQFRGNPRTPIGGATFDTGGTLQATFATTSKVVDVKCGDLCSFNFAPYGISNWLVRVTSIRPSADYEEAEVKATFHLDDWYLDSYGQTGQSYHGPANAFLLRAPYAWCPDTLAGPAGDTLFPATDLSFEMSQGYGTSQAGTIGAVLSIEGKTPINVLSANCGTPLCTTVVAGSGTLPAATYWVAAVALDSLGQRSGPSTTLPNVTLTAPGGLDISGLVWTSGTASYEIYAGSNPNHLSLQTAGTGAPPSVTISDYNIATQGPPDNLFGHFEVDASMEWHPGVWTEIALAVTDTSIQFGAFGWTANEWAGRTVSLVAKAATDAAGQPIPVMNLPVLGNTADTLTFTGGLSALGLVAGDVFTLRATANIVTATTIGDSSYASSGTSIPGVPNPVTSVTGTATVTVQTQLPHLLQTGDGAVLTNCGTDVDGARVVTVIDATTLTLNDVTITNDVLYVAGGILQPLSIGFVPSAEIGRRVLILSGTGAGQAARIIANTQTTVTVDTPWNTIPDSTSTWIVTDNDPVTTFKSQAISNQDPAQTVSLPVTLPSNVQNLSVIATVYTTGSNGLRSLQSDSPFREVFVQLPPPQTLGLSNAVPPPAGSVSVTFASDPTTPGIFSASVAVPNTGGVDHQTTTYILQVTDHGKLITFNSPTPVIFTLGDPSALGVNDDHFYAAVENIGSGTVTVDATLDGQPGPIIPQNEGLDFYSDGTGWFSMRGMGGAEKFADDEVPAGAYDGINMVFALANVPDPADSLELAINGPIGGPGIDYSLVGATIAMIIGAPNDAEGDWLRAWYRYTTPGGTMVVSGSGNTITFSGATSVAFADNLGTLDVAPIVFDSSGNLIGFNTLQLVDPNNTLLTFARPASGTLVLVATAYRQTFTSATSVSIPHNLGSLNIIPVVFDSSNNVIGFDTFVLTDANNAVLTFAVAQSGSVALILGAYSQSFTSATSVTVTHGLNSTLVTAAVYDGSNNLIEFNGFGPVDANTSTLTFAVTQPSGNVVVAAVP
jgi:hypothetical protein